MLQAEVFNKAKVFDIECVEFQVVDQDEAIRASRIVSLWLREQFAMSCMNSSEIDRWEYFEVDRDIFPLFQKLSKCKIIKD